MALVRRTTANPFVSERSLVYISDTCLPRTTFSKVGSLVDRWIVNLGNANSSYVESAIALPTAKAWV